MDVCTWNSFEDQKIEEVVHRYEFREVIESQACRLAAKNMNGWQIDGLRNHLRILSESYQNDNREKRYEASLPIPMLIS